MAAVWFDLSMLYIFIKMGDEQLDWLIWINKNVAYTHGFYNLIGFTILIGLILSYI